MNPELMTFYDMCISSISNESWLNSPIKCEVAYIENKGQRKPFSCSLQLAKFWLFLKAPIWGLRKILTSNKTSMVQRTFFCLTVPLI